MQQLSFPVNEQDDDTIGSDQAPITLIEYGDFECPECGKAYPLVKKVLGQMKNDICFVFREFPLIQIHPHAFAAAKAAEAAGAQGKFWQMHDLLFEHQQALSQEGLLVYAHQLKLDEQQFTTDMQSQSVQNKIERDIQSGEDSGAIGTPTFFINGDIYPGVLSYDRMVAILQSYLPHQSSAI